MLLSLLLLLLLPVCRSQNNQFFGTVMTYYPKNTSTNGSVTVDIRYKLSFVSCTNLLWQCLSGDCGSETLVMNTVGIDSVGGWCQTEGISTRQVPSNAPFQLWFYGSDWVTNQNAVIAATAVTLVELATRSDTGAANASPQTTILPNLTLPSNCMGNFNLLAFDPDGDNVRCRFGNASLSECNLCTPPAGLTLSSDCTFTVLPKPTIEGSLAYAVQIVMEDFPTQNITLTQTDGSQTSLTPSDPISKIPVQFLLWVAPQAPSCVSGLYIPLFLPPTPANGAQLYTPVNQNLQIDITAQANISTISDLLVSGPYNTVQSTSGLGQFTLTWTPTQSEAGESFPICFIVRAFSNSLDYQSEFRCVIVTVENSPAMSTSAPTNSTNSTEPNPIPITPTSPLDIAPNNTLPPPMNDTTASLNSFNSTAENNVIVTSATPSTTPSPPCYVVGLSMTVSSTTSLDISGVLTSTVQQVQQTLVSLGLPQDISMRLVSYTTTGQSVV